MTYEEGYFKAAANDEIGGYFVAIDHMCTKIELEVVQHVGKTLRNFILYKDRIFWKKLDLLMKYPSKILKKLKFFKKKDFFFQSPGNLFYGS